MIKVANGIFVKESMSPTAISGMVNRGLLSRASRLKPGSALSLASKTESQLGSIERMGRGRGWNSIPGVPEAARQAIQPGLTAYRSAAGPELSSIGVKLGRKPHVPGSVMGMNPRE